MKLNIYQKILVAFLVLLVAFWIVLFVTHTTTGYYNYLYSFLFGLIPFISGMVAISASRMWGGLKSTVGKAIFFVGLGILFWGAGEVIWSYYNFFAGVAAPYPSLADIGFAPSILFYGIGTIYLSVVMGAKFGLRNTRSKVFAVVAPLVIAAVSYYVLVVVARNGVVVPEGETPLKALLDIAYPLGDFVSLTLAVVISGLSFNYLGGVYKWDMISLMLGLVVMFIADSVFSYTTTVGTYYNGNWGDLLLTIGLFFLSFGAIGFKRL